MPDRCSCGAETVTTRDALGRPRDRCPRCQGVGAFGDRQPRVHISQTWTSSAQVRAALAGVVPRAPRKLAATTRGTCVKCGTPLTYVGAGRPPKRCARCVRPAERARRDRLAVARAAAQVRA